MPSSPRQYLNLGRGRALVRKSATIVSVEVYEKMMWPLCNRIPNSMVNHINVLSGRAHSTMLEEGEGGLVVSVDGEDRDRQTKVF
jgi:hypothetical protein